MDIFDTNYFLVNKKMLSLIGLWPYDNKASKNIKRSVVIIAIGIVTIWPQFYGSRVSYQEKDIYRLFERVGTLFFMHTILFKFIISIIFEDKMKVLMESMRKNWIKIVDKTERAILLQYSERGFMISVGYMTYVIIATTVYVATPLLPKFLDLVIPLNESRPKMHLLGGEFWFDADEHSWKIYQIDLMSCTLGSTIVATVDSFYANCTEHCLGLFAIVKYRLSIPNKQNLNKTNPRFDDVSYKWLIENIRIHSAVLDFASLLETSYSFAFFIAMGINLLYFSSLSVLVLMSIEKPLDFVRFTMLLAGLIIHIFYLCWPGQKLIDHSSELFRDAYNSQWYDSSMRSRKLLTIFILRCSKPCIVTAGGICTVNFSNFVEMMKKSMSFFTVFSSIR